MRFSVLFFSDEFQNLRFGTFKPEFRHDFDILFGQSSAGKTCFVHEGCRFDADNSVYQVLQGVDVELYTAKKDIATETLIEAKFAELNIVWNKYEEWLDSEECYEIVYSITL